MSVIRFPPVKSLTPSTSLLLAIATGLVVIHLHLVWGNTDFWGMSVLFWVAVGARVWEKRHTLRLESGVWASCWGTLVLAFVLLKSTLVSDNFPFAFPLLAAVGLGLLASGFQGLKQYWQELFVLFFLGLPPVILPLLVDISPLTARFAAFLLWYSGLPVIREGLNIRLPGGGVEVYSGCSGMATILFLEGLALLFLVMFPTPRRSKLLVPVVAVCLGFVVNGVRVALMTVLNANSQRAAFEYWHHGEGSQIFSLVAGVLLGLLCLLRLGETKPDAQL